MGIGLMGFFGMAVAGLIPGPKDFFSLRFFPAALCFLPTIFLGLYMGWLEKKERMTLEAFGWMSLFGVMLFQTFMWSLVSFSSLPGATVLAAFPILLAAYHGHLYQSSFKYPFPLMCCVVAIVCGYLLNHDKTHVDIMLVAAPMALGTNILLGYYAGLDFKKRIEQIALREAVDAQILEDRTRTLARISETLHELSGYNHDAGNALSGLMVMIPQFIGIVNEKNLSESKLTEAAEIAVSLGKNFTYLQNILRGSQEAVVKSGPEAVLVTPAEVVNDVCADVRHQYPHITISCTIPRELHAVGVPFFGGNVTLRRVVENVVINACQGNGKEKATVVEVVVSINLLKGEMGIEVFDDGPGFTTGQLYMPINGFQTTKKSGTGLGLYTSLRVLKANSGSLHRANRVKGRGGAVTITLKLESTVL